MKFILLPLLAFCLPLIAATYEINPNSDLIGQLYSLESERGDSLRSIARDYEMGVNEIKQANPKLSLNRRLKAGTEVIIPSQFILPPQKFRNGIVINMAELRLYYFPKNSNIVMTFPVAMGKAGWRTPTKTTGVKSKTKNPTWYVPNSIREYSLDTSGKILPEFIPPGPSNPLGRYAIYLKEKGILIHGTNNPGSIGRHASSGCIRMFNSNVKQLYKNVPVNTPVHILHHAHKLGFDQQGNVFIESHPPVSIDAEPNEYNHVNIEDEILFIESIHNANIHKPSLSQAVHYKDGLPQPIGQTKLKSYPHEDLIKRYMLSSPRHEDNIQDQ